jgi:spermidine synthase
VSGNWISETLYPGWAQSFRVERELVHHRSAYQEIRIFESATHGRVLMLDDVVQLTERDEFIYHEMIAHVPLLAQGAPERVLIIGAGDGGVLRRVLQHRSVTQAVLVEIDGEVIRLAEEFLPGLAGAARRDPRAEIILADGIAYVAAAPDRSFDVIIVDSTDPIGAGLVLFTDAFYADCARILTERGVLVNQCGVPFMQAEELRETSLRRRRAFPSVSAYVAAVPTYLGGLMTLGFAAKVAGLDRWDATTIADRAAAQGVLGKTGYWTPELHVSSFYLPPYIARHLRED